jgi:hypothetical protein
LAGYFDQEDGIYRALQTTPTVAAGLEAGRIVEATTQANASQMALQAYDIGNKYRPAVGGVWVGSAAWLERIPISQGRNRMS